MRLAATNVGDGAWMHHLIRVTRGVLGLAIVGPKPTCGVPLGRIDVAAANAQIAIECMGVRGQLLYV